MITRSQQKIDELRREPEEVRLRTALKLVLGIGITLTLISLAVLLPLQVYLTRQFITEPAVTQDTVPQVGGASDQAPQ